VRSQGTNDADVILVTLYMHHRAARLRPACTRCLCTSLVATSQHTGTQVGGCGHCQIAGTYDVAAPCQSLVPPANHDL
jgi:hypothetical protein